MTKYTTVEAEVEVDIYEVMEELSDQELMEYVVKRKLAYVELSAISMCIEFIEKNVYSIDELDKIKLRRLVQGLTL